MPTIADTALVSGIADRQSSIREAAAAGSLRPTDAAWTRQTAISLQGSEPTGVTDTPTETRGVAPAPKAWHVATSGAAASGSAASRGTVDVAFGSAGPHPLQAPKLRVTRRRTGRFVRTLGTIILTRGVG